MNRLYLKPISNCRGFTMLEAVIALLVLSVGLLGLAGLQSTSGRLSSESYQRSITTMAASEIIDKIRMRTGKVNRGLRPATIASYATTPAAGSCNPLGSGVADDLACWKINLAKELPGGDGTIINNGNGFVTVRISWQDRETGATASINWQYMVGTL